MNLSQAIWEKKYKEQRMVGVSLLDISIHSGPKKKKNVNPPTQKILLKKKKNHLFLYCCMGDCVWTGGGALQSSSQKTISLFFCLKHYAKGRKLGGENIKTHNSRSSGVHFFPHSTIFWGGFFFLLVSHWNPIEYEK